VDGGWPGTGVRRRTPLGVPAHPPGGPAHRAPSGHGLPPDPRRSRAAGHTSIRGRGGCALRVTAAPPPGRAMIPVRYGSRYGSEGADVPAARCPACDGPVPSARARYCSAACKQRAYRDRRPTTTTPSRATVAATQARPPERQASRVARTIYECPACSTRYLGERRCPDCNRFCRALGPGEACPSCDEPILLADLLD
jgi:hypothetical protein